MGTPACIAVISGDKVTWTYVNCDGHIETCGRKLIEHYNDQELAEKLISMGDISVLEKSMECPVGHSFATPAPGCTIFYDRDRGEDNVKPRHGDLFLYLRCNKGVIRYMFKDGQWHVVRQTSNKGPLTERYTMFVLGEVLSGLHD